MADSLTAAADDVRDPFWTASRTILGTEGTLDSTSDRDRYSKDCGLASHRPRAVLVPSTIEQLRDLVVAASTFRVQLHPISRGKNWGYGSASPPQNGAFIVDLGRLNKIRHLDRELAYVVIEPGVTQQQLFDHLEKHAPELCMDVTGSSPDSSLIGNLVERGYGQTPYGDRFLNSSGIEVMLSDGTTVKLGFGHYRNSKSHHLYKWGIGPYLDGLFTQSNFGIVISAGLWLMPKPQEIGLLTFAIETNTDLLSVLSVMRSLKLRGLLPATVHISNDIRLASCFTQFPFHSQDPSKALSVGARHEIARKYGFGKWNVFTSLRGSARLVRASFRDISDALKSKAQPELISRRSVEWSRRLGSLSPVFLGRSAKETAMLYNLVSGRPTEGPTLGAYWRHPEKPASRPLDPAADGCGLVWLAPIIPTTETEVRPFLELTENILEGAGFELNVTLTMLSERALCATVAIAFDKAVDSGRARDCYDTLLGLYATNGWIPYRHGINVEATRDVLFNESDPFWRLCHSLKQAVDPHGTFSPGKYGL